MSTPQKRQPKRGLSPFPYCDSFATVEPSGCKPDLFMLTSFDTTLPQKDVSEEEISIVFPDDCENGDLSKIRTESGQVQQRVLSFLHKVRNEPTRKSGSFHQLTEDLVTLSSQIGRLSDVVYEKEREMEKVVAENKLLQMKLRQLGTAARRREERVEVEVEEGMPLPSCDLCTLF